MRNRIILWAVLLVAAFLIGFVPSYVRANALSDQLESARTEVAHLRLLDAVGLAYMQAAQKNYGLAQDSSTKFFILARQTASRTGNTSLKQSLESLLNYQNTVTAKLARGEPGALDDLSALYNKTREAIRS